MLRLRASASRARCRRYDVARACGGEPPPRRHQRPPCRSRPLRALGRRLPRPRPQPVGAQRPSNGGTWILGRHPIRLTLYADPHRDGRSFRSAAIYGRSSSSRPLAVRDPLGPDLAIMSSHCGWAEPTPSTCRPARVLSYLTDFSADGAVYNVLLRWKNLPTLAATLYDSRLFRRICKYFADQYPSTKVDGFDVPMNPHKPG